MFKNTLTILMVYLLSTTQVMANINAKDQFIKTLTKYDYMLSAHPKAHIDSFREKAMKDFENEVKELSKDLTNTEVKEVLNRIIKEIPSKRDQEQYKFLIQEFSKTKNLEILNDKTFINKTFRGEGSNFTTNVSQNVLLINALILGLVIAVIVLADDSSSNVEAFGSSPLFFTSHGQDCWLANPFMGDYYYDEARANCEAYATYPETCRFGYLDTRDNGFNSDDDFFKSCIATVYFVADKELNE